MTCNKCGYSFTNEKLYSEKVYLSCTRCGERLPTPVCIGIKQEGQQELKEHKPLVETV